MTLFGVNILTNDMTSIKVKYINMNEVKKRKSITKEKNHQENVKLRNSSNNNNRKWYEKEIPNKTFISRKVKCIEKKIISSRMCIILTTLIIAQ